MRRWISFLLAIVLIVFQIPSIDLVGKENIVNAASTDIIITEVKTEVNGKDVGIKNKDQFKLTLTLENKSGKTLTDTSLGIGSSKSFKLIGTGSNKTFSFGTGVIDKISFDLIYNGGEETEIPITIYYNIEGIEGKKSLL